MADPNTRQGKRTPVTLKIKFKSETLEQFIERYAVDVSQGGIFIRTKEPLAVGTQMRFEFQLRDASPLIAGEGTVVWTRENDPSRPAIAPGMGVRFDRLAEGSQGVLERILAEKAKQAPQRPPTETTKPPMFTDTPTRVAPAPVQEALLGNESSGSGGPKRKRPDSFGDQGTPLPRPMPFHSDADEFPEEAFEEATKVRALDELIAQTADATATTTLRDELADRRPRADSTLADAPSRAETRAETVPAEGAVKQPHVDRDSAPGLPSPPEARSQPKLLDTTPSPRSEPSPSTPPATQPNPAGLKTQLGMEPAKMPLRPSTPSTAPATSPAPQRPVAKDAITKPTGMRAVAAEPRLPEATKKSSAPILLLLLLLVAAGAAATWFFFIRPQAGDDAVTHTAQPGSNGSAGSAGSAIATNPNGSNGSAGSDGSAGVTSTNGSNGSAGSAGSAVAMTGSNGSNGSATAPAAEIVETLISAPGIDKATVEVTGTDQTGPAPLKAKLEKGKAYKAHVMAPGFAMLDLEVKGGEKAIAKLVAKPRVITVNSDPPGALIFIDSAATGHSTPFDVELTKVQAARKSVRVLLRKGGYEPIERVVDAGKYTEDAAQMIAKLDEKMSVRRAVVNNNTTNNNTTNNTVKTGSNGSAGSAGSATPTNGSNDTGSNGGTTGGSAVTPPTGTGTGSNGGTTGGSAATPPTGTGTGSGSAAKPTPPAGTGSGSATTTGQTLKDGPKEPEPDFVKKLP